MLTKDFAICIRAVDYSETSQVVTLFTRAAGKIGAIAKGSKRPKSAFDGPIEILAAGQIVFTPTAGEKLATLTEFQQQPGPAGLSNNLFALNCALFTAELINLLTDDYDPHPQLFDDFLQFLQNTRHIKDKSDALRLLILFQLSLLKEVGVQPELNHCVNCKTNDKPRVSSIELYFSSSANGLVCRDCEANFPDRIKLSADAANCLRNLKLIAGANEKMLNEIEAILVHYFTELLHKPPKMAKYILK